MANVSQKAPKDINTTKGNVFPRKNSRSPLMINSRPPKNKYAPLNSRSVDGSKTKSRGVSWLTLKQRHFLQPLASPWDHRIKESSWEGCLKGRYQRSAPSLLIMTSEAYTGVGFPNVFVMPLFSADCGDRYNFWKTSGDIETLDGIPPFRLCISFIY